ncbi:MAG: UDP-N-acetylmuramate dehydrogenase [Phycisphaerales bacterium]
MAVAGKNKVAASGSVGVEHDAEIPTWFGIGGRAERLARPESVGELGACLRMDRGLRVLGDGANLLVDDDGVPELVVSLASEAFTEVRIDDGSGRVTAGAGANLPKVITETVRRGLAGLEGLAGIPATVGGAAIMNAGGAFGQICDSISAVNALDRGGHEFRLLREQIDFRYRHSGLDGLIITSVEFELREEDPAALRTRLKEVMEYKKNSQPMGERSAGCVFRNPTLRHDVPDIGPAGERVSAGMLLDRAGCKGMRCGGASVSPRHANFVVTEPGATARDVIELMSLSAERVLDRFGVTLDPEVVIWSRHDRPTPHRDTKASR